MCKHQHYYTAWTRTFICKELVHPLAWVSNQCHRKSITLGFFSAKWPFFREFTLFTASGSTRETCNSWRCILVHQPSQPTAQCEKRFNYNSEVWTLNIVHWKVCWMVQPKSLHLMKRFTLSIENGAERSVTVEEQKRAGERKRWRENSRHLLAHVCKGSKVKFAKKWGNEQSMGKTQNETCQWHIYCRYEHIKHKNWGGNP